MNVNRIHEILRMTTRPFRKGPAVLKQHASTAYFAMPHVDTAAPNLRKVDVHYIVVTVDQDVAETLGNCLGSTIADFSRNVDTSGRLADALYGHMRRAIRASMTDSCEVDCHTASFHVPITEGGSA